MKRVLIEIGIHPDGIELLSGKVEIIGQVGITPRSSNCCVMERMD